MGKYVVIDLEMCKVDKSMKKEFRANHEIIQIGAVLLGEDLKVEDKFNRYVKPEFGWIDPFIEKLTGISQEHVKNASMLAGALEEFLAWLPEDATAVSWSMTDRQQLSKELTAKGMANERMNRLFETWIDCQKEFGKKVQACRQYSLKEAMIATDVVGDDREHDGLADAYNAALLFAKMEQEEVLTLNPYYSMACREEKSETLGFSLGDLLKGLNIQNTTA